jgi:hypothetical protein
MSDPCGNPISATASKGATAAAVPRREHFDACLTVAETAWLLG